MPIKKLTEKLDELLGDDWDDSGEDGAEAPDEAPDDEPNPEELLDALLDTEREIDLKDASAVFVGPTDEETGLKPVILKQEPEKSAEPPAKRGRHVGGRALALLSRIPLVGLKHIRASSEFVVYDDQPPPSGEYAVQALGVSTLEYDGVKQNHLLVTFKSGQLTGFAVEDTYTTFNTTYSSGLTDFEIDLATALIGRSARTIAIATNRNITIRLNASTNNSIYIPANISPFIIDLGLNIEKLYLTTAKETKLRLEAW